MYIVSSVIIAVITVLFTLPSHAEEASLEVLSWLSGCWAMQSAEKGSGEQWMTPAGGMMLGAARTVRNGKTVDYEFMQIRATADGKIVFIALPSGQEETSFTAVNIGMNSVTFENLEHDFPNRIIYRKVSNTAIIASIEGTQNGPSGKTDFPMQKISCEENN